MNQLLNIEFAKLKKLNSIKVIFIIYMVMVPLLIYALGAFFGSSGIPFLPTKAEFWSFPTVWKFTTYCASYFNVLMGVIIVIITCNEFSNRTFKQNIIDGMTKKDVIFSKMFVILFTSILVTIYTSLVAITFGLINSLEMNMYQNVHYIFIYFLQTLAYFSFAFLFAVLVKKSAMSIIFFVLSFLFETIVGAFLPKIVYLYFPLNIFSKLTPIPFFDNFIKMAEKQSGEIVPRMEMYTIILFAIFYMSLFFIIAYQALKRRDL
jgi:ABC-type transport system involved in multi-copper enzyme maturation permease subunit